MTPCCTGRFDSPVSWSPIDASSPWKPGGPQKSTQIDAWAISSIDLLVLGQGKSAKAMDHPGWYFHAVRGVLNYFQAPCNHLMNEQTLRLS